MYVRFILYFDIILNLFETITISVAVDCHDSVELKANVTLFNGCTNDGDFMMSLSAYICKDAEIIEAFNRTSRYLDDLLNIDNTYFDVWSNKFTNQNFN